MSKGAEPRRKVTKPKSVFTKPMKADFKGLFVALTKGIAAGATFQWEKVAGEAATALTKLGLKSEPGELAWLLLRRAMTLAIFDLVKDSADLLTDTNRDEAAAAALLKRAKDIDKKLDDADLSLDQKLFDRPEELSIVSEVRASLVEWAKACGLTKERAASLAGRLPGYFVFELSEEWRKNPEQYKPVLDVFKTPFTPAAERDRLWSAYTAYLQRQVSQSMMGEAFGLRDVYVPVRAYVEQRPIKPKRAERGIDLADAPDPDDKKSKRIVVDLKKALVQWIEKGDPGDTLRVISGGPGSGKSSFARIFAAWLARQFDIRVLYVPLHLFDIKGSLAASVDAFCSQFEMLPSSGLLDPKTGENRLLILFDGLDELSKQGKSAADAARQFVNEVDKGLSTRNTQSLHAQALIMGRPIAVAGQETEFRGDGKIYHVMPYHLTEEELEEHEYVDSAKLLQNDQRNDWWRKYGEAVGEDYTRMPDDLAGASSAKLTEITAQPLLNYLVALSYRRDKAKFKGLRNLNELYADLLAAVYERGWERRRQHVKELTSSQFEHVLEEIGLAAWHGDGRQTTVSQILSHCKASPAERWLGKFQEGAEAGVTRLLTAFYFRQTEGVATEETFEFTHKSFGEYLTARRIVRCLEWMHEEYRLHEAGLGRGRDSDEVLTKWAEVCGPAVLDSDLARFVVDEIALRDKTTAEAWQTLLCRLIEHMLRNGMPMQHIQPRPAYAEENRQAINAEEGLLMVLCACAVRAERLSEIRWPTKTSAGEWIGRIRGQRSDSPIRGLPYLCRLDLSGCVLFVADLWGANLAGAKFDSATLSNAKLLFADLAGADFKRAYLIDADLTHANLTNACLTGANLAGADLTHANLTDADLTHAKLIGVNLYRANLTRADFSRANLIDTDLSGVNATDAKFDGVKHSHKKRTYGNG